LELKKEFKDEHDESAEATTVEDKEVKLPTDYQQKSKLVEHLKAQINSAEELEINEATRAALGGLTDS